MSEDQQLTSRKAWLRITAASLAAMGFIGLALALVHWPPRVRLDLVKEGMTVGQVEAILGKPLDVMDVGPRKPTGPLHQFRTYRGNGSNTIRVHFIDGVVDAFQENGPISHDWIKVG